MSDVSRPRVLRPILDVVGTILIALLLLSILFVSVPEGFRVLFNFMDVGLGLWAVLLIVVTTRGAVTGRRAYLFLVIGAVVNLLVVTTVGFVQTGGWAGDLILFAVEAGISCLVAGALVITLVHRTTAGRAAP